MHALMVGYDNQRSISGNVIRIGERIGGAQNMCATDQAQIHQTNTFFMCFVTENSMAAPLHGVKYQKCQGKEKHVDDRQRICE